EAGPQLPDRVAHDHLPSPKNRPGRPTCQSSEAHGACLPPTRLTNIRGGTRGRNGWAGRVSRMIGGGLMLGALAGDVIGSGCEGKKRWMVERSADFQPLFSPKARFTDDTVLTMAVADALLHGGDLVDVLKDYYGRYPWAGFGGDFRAWAASDDPRPYNSWGN